MALTPGVRLGPYEVIALLGAGGMGQVYRARDDRLNRDVALKVLPDTLARDADRLARFRREAQVLASLNHPNIAAIHGLEESDGMQALVLELVVGPTLADRIAGRPSPVDEALPIARQMAEALEAAHEHGIIHRDLKPANVKVRPDGTVKVLDFGLARLAHAPGPGPQASDLTASPTMTNPAMTRMGVILGTAAYMSPEQARGREVDKRADIWAFGCVLYELLTGKPAFPGENVTEVLANVVKSDIAWNALPPETPPKVRALIRRCLQKDPKQRLRDIGDARIEIEEALAAPWPEAVIAATTPGHGRDRVAWSVAAVAVVAALAGLATSSWRQPMTPDTQVYRSSLLPPPGTNLQVFPHARLALSPDGRRLAWSATAGGPTQLWVQSLDELQPQPIAGTEGAAAPFWSPDGRFVGFYAGGLLKTIDVAGGPALTVAEVGTGYPGATWSHDDVILFSRTGDGSVVRRVSAAGGAVSPVTSLDRTNGEAQHWAPFFLPDGRHFLYMAVGTKGAPTDINGVYVAAIDSPERKLLVPGGATPRYAQGYLVFLRGRTLLAQPFDVDRLELTGDALPIARQVAVGGITGRMGAVSVSDTGTLVYQASIGGELSQLEWYDRAGRRIEAIGERGDYGDLELSPDGRRALVSVGAPTGNVDIWILDLARGVRTRFTFDPALEAFPLWSPDGSRVVFGSNRRGGVDIYHKASSGAGSEEPLHVENGSEYPLDWSRDGRSILYSRNAPGSGVLDLWVLPLEGKPSPFLQTPFDKPTAAVSPDGRWAAYVSNESGRNEVYVTSFPMPAGKWQVSTAGGSWPRWNRDGRELFYLAPDNRLITAAVNGEASGFEVGTVRALFQTQARVNQRSMYDVSPDGQRFLVNTLVEQAVQPVTLVVNWTGALRK